MGFSGASAAAAGYAFFSALDQRLRDGRLLLRCGWFCVCLDDSLMDCVCVLVCVCAHTRVSACFLVRDWAPPYGCLRVECVGSCSRGRGPEREAFELGT